MYGKLFESMYDGSLYGQWEAIVTFQQMIVLADMDGTIDVTPQALAARTSIPLDIISKGLKVLLEPDAYSRSPAEEGRRIVSLDPNRPWGWRIVNHAHYRALRSAEERRKYQRDYWHKRKTQPDSTVTQQTQPIAEAEADTEAKETTEATGVARCPRDEIISLYHELLPMCPRVEKWTDTRKRLLNARWKEHPAMDLWRQYFTIVSRSRFLTGKTSGTKDRPPFLANLEWLISATNFANVMEGKYDNR